MGLSVVHNEQVQLKFCLYEIEIHWSKKLLDSILNLQCIIYFVFP